MKLCYTVSIFSMHNDVVSPTWGIGRGKPRVAWWPPKPPWFYECKFRLYCLSLNLWYEVFEATV
jgi:hypothetical protein